MVSVLAFPPDLAARTRGEVGRVEAAIAFIVPLGQKLRMCLGQRIACGAVFVVSHIDRLFLKPVAFLASPVAQ
jgi:hypothetical protein